MANIGFVGIGAMGEPMAANLLKKGFNVTVLRHRREEPAQRLQAQGARVAASLDPIADSDLVVLCLPTSREVEATLVDDGGLIDRLRGGAVIVDCSTSEPQSTAELTELTQNRNVGLIAAAMTRGVAGAKQGTLAFFVGGEAEHVEKAQPLLEAMGNTFIRFPPSAWSFLKIPQFLRQSQSGSSRARVLVLAHSHHNPNNTNFPLSRVSFHPPWPSGSPSSNRFSSASFSPNLMPLFGY